MKKFLFLLLIFANLAFAAEEMYPFTSNVDRIRFDNLTSQLRCLVCQNQTIAESNAALATDLKSQIYQKIQKGESDQRIFDFLISRYGNFILYQPPFRMNTLILWFGPLLFLLGGLTFLIFYLRRNRT